MEDLIMQMEGTEFAGFGELLAGVSDEELLGAIKRNPKGFKRAVAQKTASTNKQTTAKAIASSVPAAASRGEFEERMNLLSPDLQAGLRNKSLQLADHTVYVTKSISGLTSIKMFEDADDKIVGVSNISSGKLEKNEVFLLSGIQLLYGVGTGTAITKDGVAAVTQWLQIPLLVENGEFTFKVSQKTLLDRVSNSIFKRHMAVETTIQAGGANVGGSAWAVGEGMPGFFKLANPKMIETQQSIEMNLEWCAAAASNSYLKAILWGTKVMKY